MGNVYSITLCDRDLHHVPDDIYKHHKHVAKLLLRRNNIQEIPPDIKVLTNLVELSLRDNLITSVPQEITNLKLLQKLSLANNRLQEPPEPIAAFSQLTWLSLASNTLTTLPIAFSQLQKLTSLDLQRNRFIAIPDCIFEMKSLTVLLLQKNRITSISPKIGQCVQLVSLNLSYNRLQRLPVEMAECRNLQHLLLSVNQIQALPAILCEAWVNLLNLDMHTNDLKKLPDQLGSMRSLRRLNLAINKIEDVPGSIGQLQLLEWLNLNDNKLVTLPGTMDQMQKLVKMGIVQNKLRTLPSALARLSSLYKLDCRRNEIEYLPSAFKEMQAIHSLLLEENPLNFKYGVSDYDRQPVTLLEMATRAVLERYSPQNQRDQGKGCLTSDMCLSPDSMYSSDMSEVSGTGPDANIGMGISHLLPAMADLGLTRASTLPAPDVPTIVATPQKSRYSFFSRACSTVHPSSIVGNTNKPTRSSTLTSAHSSDASSSDTSSNSHFSSSSSSSSTPSTSSPPSVTSSSSTSLSSSLTCATMTPGNLLTAPTDNLRIRPSRQKSSPRSLRPPSIFRRHSSRNQREQTTLQQQQQQQHQLDRALVRPLISPIQAEIVHAPQEETLATMSPETYPKRPQPVRRRRHVSKLERLLDPETSLLPIPLIDLLSMPTTACDYCHRRMFTSGWITFLEPVKLGASSRTIVPIRHQLCSLQCVRWQYKDSFGSEMVDTFEQTEFHLSQNGDLIGTRPILPEEMDEVMIEAVQEAAEQAGISIAHILEQFSQHNQQTRGQQAGSSSSSSPPSSGTAAVASPVSSTVSALDSTTANTESAELTTAAISDSVPGVPGSITIAAINRMVPASDPSSITHSLPSVAPTMTLALPTPGSILRQTTARIRRSLSRPMTPIEIQVDAHGQLRRIIYRQSRPAHPPTTSNNHGQQAGPGAPNNGNNAAAAAGGGTSHRRRLLDTFRSLSQVGHGGLAAGLGTGGGGGIGGGGAMGMVAVSATAAADGQLGGIPQHHGGAGGVAAAQAVATRAAGEVVNVTTFSVELERF
ncbi:hypothetical protein EMPS_06819 [Entomortierella parvispora]|uniref:Uncharacterized protein n=1 Tax=Entomortierella parvispora TaxID=205924 RepID=A0A9P3HD84_9FUNG|nr:hypothetical protein EMPS_06819 [Entomortierella parvispora]